MEKTKDGKKNSNPEIKGLEAYYSWSVDEQVHHRPFSNNNAVFLVLVLMLTYSIFSNNPLLGIITVLVGLIFYLFDKKESDIFSFSITEEGILADDYLYPYENIESFWIFEHQDTGKKELSLKTTRAIMPYVRIPLGESDPDEMRYLLEEVVEEQEHQESLADVVEKAV